MTLRTVPTYEDSAALPADASEARYSHGSIHFHAATRASPT